MIKTKVAFLDGQLLSSQSEQSENFSKRPDWLDKNHFCFDQVNRLIVRLQKEKAMFSVLCVNNNLCYLQGSQLHRRQFAIIITQAKCDAIMNWTNRFDFFAIIKNFLMRYYRSAFSIIICNFRFFS